MKRFLPIAICIAALLAITSALQVSGQSVANGVKATLTPRPTTTLATVTSSIIPTPTVALSATLESSALVTATQENSAPLIYFVSYGDSLLAIANAYGVTVNELMESNAIVNPDLIYVGQKLVIPNRTVSLDAAEALSGTAGLLPSAAISRATIVERMTNAARGVSSNSPFYKRTWLTYYGRPNIPVMGILGEYDIAGLTDLLRQKAVSYDEANGAELDVVPAFHLVYGMATRAPGDDGSHLAFMPDAQVTDYISAALESKFQVILDIQIGALTPAEALEYGFRWLKYENVHLALDPEFAMVYPGQNVPGNPAGYVTAEQINDAQASMQRYLQKNKIKGKRVLLLHQFLDTMIVDKADLANDFAGIELVISVDGWGPPAGKVSKYNLFIDETVHFSSFKLFYRWDEPLMSEREALGEESINGYDYIEVTPNMIIYQ